MSVRTRKNLPDMITTGRILLSLVLLAVSVESAAFFVIYAACGATDVLDGFFARRYGTCSKTGARYDSFADTVFFGAMVIKLWSELTANKYILAACVLTAAVKLSAAATAKMRFGVFGFSHTYLNKITGFLLFLYPLTMLFSTSPLWLLIPAVPAAASAGEDAAIAATAVRWDYSRRGLFLDMDRQRPEAGIKKEEKDGDIRRSR